jgi:hypothetical protein
VIIYAALKTLLEHPEVARGETALMIPLVSLLLAFLVIRGVYAEEGIHPLVFTLLAMALCLISRAKHSISAAKPAPVAARPVAPLLKRTVGRKVPSEEVKKSASFAVVLAVVLACAVAYYLACLAWALVHHSAG